MYFQTRLKSSFYPVLKPITSPGINPKPAAMGNPEVTIIEVIVGVLESNSKLVSGGALHINNQAL
jgi:hypothetical protein